MATSFDYDVFVSYSRDQLDRDVTVRLQDELQRFTRPWYRPRARTLRVFRDQTNLPASPDLWGTLEAALSSSQWLVLVASPRSAHSAGVRHEVEWWREHRGPANFCIALVDGDLRWDDARNDFDWEATTALPREALEGAFAKEPAWIDLRPVMAADGASRRGRLHWFTRSPADPRLQDATASMLAEIRQVPKDTLIGEHLRRSRQTVRAVTSTLVALVLLLAAAITAASIAATQRDRAIHQATISESGQLAAIAGSLTGSNLDLAQLFAAEAYKLYPDPQTRAALFDAVTADPDLVRYLQATGTVSAVAGSADASTVVAGTANGDVLRWNLTDFRRTLVASLPAAVSGVGVSADGDTIAAVDGSVAEVWVQGHGVRSVPVPPEWTTVAAAVSASGQYVAFSVHGTNYNSPYYLMLIDERTGHSVMVPVEAYNLASNLSFSGDNQLVVLDDAYGNWERLAIPSLAVLAASSAEFGAHDYAAAISSTGTYISYTNAGSPLQVWTTTSTPTPAFAPPLGATEVGNDPNAIAISADGQRAADADAGTIYVSAITAYKNATSSFLVALNGNDRVNTNGLTFIGPGDNELLSASNDLIALWNLDQDSRISAATSVDLPMGCDACGGPGIGISPKSNNMVLTADNGDTAVDMGLPLSAGRSQAVPLNGTSGTEYGPAVWSQDGEDFSILTPSDGGGEVWSAAGHLAFLRNWGVQPAPAGAYDSENNQPGAARLVAGGREILEVDSAGNVVMRDAKTGAVEHEVAGPINPHSASNSGPYAVAADPEARYAAVIVQARNAEVDVVNIKTGVITTVPGDSATGVAYDGELLLVQRPDGTLEVRSADGRRLIHTFTGVANPAAGPVVGDNGLAVELNTAGTAEVFDVASGLQVGSFTVPAGQLTAFTSIAFTPDGNDLITATEGDDNTNGMGEVIEWNFSSSLWSKIACASAGHSLSAAEWQEYVGTSGSAMPANVACGS